MKQLASSILFVIAAVNATLATAPTTSIQEFVLDDHAVYAVPVSGNRVTTISFPSAISAIDAALVTMDVKAAGLFQIAHTKGTSYLSARAIVKGASTNVNVRWNDRTYVLELKESADPWLSVIFQTPADRKNIPPRPVTPDRLLGMLDKAKAYPVLKEHHPEALAGMEYRQGTDQPASADNADYVVQVNEMFRFDNEDTLVFHLTRQNKTDRVIEFTPEHIQLKVGNYTLLPSVTQLGSILPSNGSSEGYIAFTGTPQGERNDVSLKNDFSFVMESAYAGSGLIPTDNQEENPQ